MKIIHFKWILIILLVGIKLNAFGQYFGENKVQYEDFNFYMYKTPHFDIYNYLKDTSSIEFFGKLSEKWYNKHHKIFRDTLKKNPIILYNNHADFKQTSVIQGQISVGTGGVTEALRNRVVIPFTRSNKETSHVLGHEMVHAFQYNLIKEADSLNLQQVNNIPLWMVEGLAEYLSVGKQDNRTAMWMRDAVLSNDIPTLKDMSRRPNKYFPYRYGHAFWAFITGNWGEKMITPLFTKTAKFGYKRAIDSLFRISADSLSKIWERQLKKSYKPFLKDSNFTVGEKVFGPKNAGTMNLSPVLGPNGRYMVFISNKDVINTNYFVADIKKQKIIKKISAPLRKSHIDAFNYLESVGSWSPNGNKFVISLFSKGKNILKILQIKEGEVKTLQNIKIPELESFNNPQWSPDGKRILLSGLQQGKSDLFIYSLKKQKLKRLTNDRYSDIQPTWGPNGDKIAFISDRGNDTNIEKKKFGTNKICTYNLETSGITYHPILPGAEKFSPEFSYNGNSIFFLSHADGYRNLYEYKFEDKQTYRLTTFPTGISGITDLSPSFSVAGEDNQFLFTLYRNKKYSIHKAKYADFNKEKVSPDELNQYASFLVPMPKKIKPTFDRDDEFETDTNAYTFKPYNPKFQLEHIGSSGVGFATSQYGNAMAGGVSAMFGDMLNNHQIYSMLRVNGKIYDIAGQAAYINRENRISWGGSFSHTPYKRSYGIMKEDSITIEGEDVPVKNVVYLNKRMFQDELSIFGQYPLSKHTRFEAGVSSSIYSFRYDSINNYYYGNIRETKETQIDAPEPFFLARANVAFVGDHSDFGMTSPLNGYRYRFEIDQSVGRYNFTGLKFDYRKYFFRKPFSFALRGLHYGRYGKDADELYPYYVGQNYFLRGYTARSFQRTNCQSEECFNMDKLTGSKMFVTNAEIRLPFSGVKRLALIKSRYVMSDLVYFIDAGIAWNSDSNFEMSWDLKDKSRTPVISTGLGVRINLFGYAILQPYVAIPFQRKNMDFSYGIGISGGGW